MRILAFTDIHGSLPALKRIEQKVKANKPDLLVCAGDISIFEHGIVKIFRQLNKISKQVIIVHGNHESIGTFIKFSKIFKNIVFIHKRGLAIDNVLFLGYGGGGFSVMDKDFEKKAQERFKKIILVTHAPPYKTMLDKLVGGHCGNKSIRNFIEKSKIDLVICGHLHENFGKEDKIKNTKVINPGPFGKVIKL